LVVCGGGVARAPNPQTPKPQSPIPNPQLLIFKKCNLN